MKLHEIWSNYMGKFTAFLFHLYLQTRQTREIQTNFCWSVDLVGRVQSLKKPGEVRNKQSNIAFQISKLKKKCRNSILFIQTGRSRSKQYDQSEITLRSMANSSCD